MILMKKNKKRFEEVDNPHHAQINEELGIVEDSDDEDQVKPRARMSRELRNLGITPRHQFQEN